MSVSVFYMGSVVLVGLGSHFIRKTHPYCRIGGSAYERRTRLRLAGKIMLALGILFLMLGLLAQLVVSYP